MTATSNRKAAAARIKAKAAARIKAKKAREADQAPPTRPRLRLRVQPQNPERITDPCQF